MPKGEYLQYGGQAVIEGVMMRSPNHWAVACRAPDGRIVLHCEPLEKTWIGRQKWLKAPFLRGSLGILDAMSLGTKAMRFSSEIQLEDEKQVETPETDAAEQTSKSAEGTDIVHRKIAKPTGNLGWQIAATMIVGFAIGIFLFALAPNTIAEFSGVKGWIGKNLVSEIIKIVFFLLYVGLIGLMPDIRRVFQFHGAEHKAINALEADQPLDLVNAGKQTRLHPRCGTSFAIIVLILSLLVFTFVTRYPLGESANKFLNAIIRVGVEICLLPLVAGTAYEALRIAGKFRSQLWVKIAFFPGLMTQYLTTRHPDDEHVEVALVSLRAVLAAEEAGKSPIPAEIQAVSA